MQVTLVGGGVGGLAAAGELLAHGLDVTVLETAPGPHEVGAGVQLSPNAVRLLERRGLGPALRAVSVRPTAVRVRRWEDDAVLSEGPLGDAVAERFGAPYLNAHRADLARVLAAGVPADRVRYGVHVAEVGSASSGVVLTDRTGTRWDADVLVGADGVHSAVRAAVVGAVPARFGQCVAYRALLPLADVPPAHREAVVTNRVGPQRHVVTYRVGDGGRFLNLVAVVPEPAWDVESWTEPGSADALRGAFAEWSAPLRDLLECVREPVYRWALFDREPLPRWGVGRITLLGDACHPMLPFLAQGACQAIEDAAVLARELARAGAPEDALRAYELARLPRTSRIQRRAWANNTVFHLPDGDEQRARDEAWAGLDAGAWLASNDWLYGWRLDE